MKNFKLSICVPTFNRSKYLDLFLSKLAQVDNKILDQIELKIYDNCSTDNTFDVIEKFNSKFHVTYKKQKENIGGTNNVIDIIQNCKGEYIWVLGDDDYVIKSNLEAFFNQYLTNELNNNWFFVSYEDGLINLPFDHEKICLYFQENGLEKTILKYGSHIFGFLGSHVFSKSCLDKSFFEIDFSYNRWPHITLLLRSNHNHIFLNQSLSVKAGDLEWDSSVWFVTLLSQILSLDNSYFSLTTKTILMIRLTLSKTFNKHLIYSRISTNYDYKLLNQQIWNLKSGANSTITKLILSIPVFLNLLLKYIPTKLIMSIFRIKPHRIEINSNEAYSRKI